MGKRTAKTKFGLQTPKQALRRTGKARRSIRFEKDDWYATASRSIAIEVRGPHISGQWRIMTQTDPVDDHD